MSATTAKTIRLPLFLAAMMLLLVLGGCAGIDFGGNSDEAQPAASPSNEAPLTGNQPYYPTDFKDLLIPGELSWNRDKSMSIKTDSFAGGILNFSGRLEINSLTEFFNNTMPKNGWKVSGTVKHKSNLLVFVKPHKTCMITVSESEFGLKTEVYVYITEDLGDSAAAREEIIR
ncbi:MAG: hypothetical protein OEV91_02030 [Desulfobulbaceae bacterium]|nr:hypothetical protein [Desulfobulbaceae bacterium]